ncbi:AraC family transcriptional regulator [Balneatrix alpica]|uniref:AraC family transcriptional regulator n=1 Tax=Balneatrix alpica TaxID=75684 RepID=UPI002739208A|nr:AraC family transcriptional regulator [Balneatrix alpica]
MSRPSDWPLPPHSVRVVLPAPLVDTLSSDPLTRGLYPLSLGHYQQAQGHQMQRQRHDDYLLIYCTQGAGWLELGGQRRRIQAGDLVLLPKGVRHSYQACQQQPWSIYWAHFDGHMSPLFLEQMGFSGDHYLLRLGLHPKLIQDFDTLLQVRQTGFHRLAFIHASNLLKQMLSYIALLQHQLRLAEQPSLDLAQVHALMLEKVHEQLDLDTLAASVGLSKFHFLKKYRELTGTTPIKHFIHLKIERACYLMDISQHPINEISQALGYEDAYYFSRLFKKVMGMAPSAYRKLTHG